MGGLSNFLGDLTGGLIGTSSAEEAVPGMQQISEEAKQEALAELGESWDDIQGFMQPYLDAGTAALSDYRQAIGAAPDAPVFEEFDTEFVFDPSKMEKNPAYQFVLDQSMQAFTRSAAKNRALTSGNRIAGATELGAGLASTEYGNEFQRQLQGYQQDMQRYQLNRGTKQLGFENKYRSFRDRVGDTGQLMSQGGSFATNLANMRLGTANQRTNIIANRAAESTAANLLPIQERQNFTQSLLQGGGLALGAFLSDQRAKENIKPVGTLDNGLTVYQFNYIGDPMTVIGVMAQEVEQIHPHAVVEHEGYKYVDYSEAVKPARRLN